MFDLSFEGKFKPVVNVTPCHVVYYSRWPAKHPPANIAYARSECINIT